MIMTSQEAADYLRIAEQTLRNSRSTGCLFGFETPPFMKLGHLVRYRKTDLDAWLALTQEGTEAQTHQLGVRVCG